MFEGTLKQSTAVTVTVLLISSTDHIAGKTGLSAGLTIYATKAGGTPAAITPTVTELDATNMPGLYSLALTTTHTNTLGEFAIRVSGSGADPSDVKWQVSARLSDDLAYPATSGRSIVVDAAGLVDANTVKVGPTGSGTAQTARDIGASVLLSNGTGTGQLKLASGYVAMTWADIAAPTTTVAFTGTTIASTQKVDVETIKTKAVTAGAGVTFPASIGTSTLTQTQVTGGAYALNSASFAWNSALDLSTTQKASVTTAATAATPTAAAVTGAVGSVTGNVGGNVTGSVGSVVGAVGSVTGAVGSVTGLTASDVAAIKAKTDNLPSDPADASDIAAAFAVVNGNILTASAIRAAVGLASANLDSQLADKTGFRLSTTGVNDILRTALTEGYAADGATFTVEQGFYMLWSLLAERSLAGTTLTAKKLDGSTSAMAFTLDDGTTPTSQTRTA